MNALEQQFQRNFDEGLEQGASVSIWKNGQELVSLSGGLADKQRAWTQETLVPIYSATKVPAAACLLLALYNCCQTPELAVGDIWPAFPAPRCTVAQLLSHQAGLAALDEPASILDLDACRTAIERTHPQWAPPVHGYHPHTFGPVLDILMIELTGKRLGAYWEEHVRRPLGLDLFIGLPSEEQGRVAMLRAPRCKGRMPTSPFYTRFFDSSSLVYRAFHSVTGLSTPREMNTPAAWECASPAKGGVASARGLAQFYQYLMGLLPHSPFPLDVLEWMSIPQCTGMDQILCCETSFTCGAMCAPEKLFGRSGWGHAGAGGCHAFCEPESGLSFAYVMNAMEMGILPGPRVQKLISALQQEG